MAIIGSLLILGMTLFTNQYFHGGLWGPLHNKSVKPKMEISQITVNPQWISFDLYRVEGVDVYGAFLIKMQLTNQAGDVVWEMESSDLANFPEAQIDNFYIAQIRPHHHSLLAPLGAKATLKVENLLPKEGEYTLSFTDISGATWSKSFDYKIK